MKTYILKFEVFWDATDIRTVTVNANTERKAIIFATKKIKKETGWNMPKLISCQEVDSNGTH
jgi:hypothetical protein